MRRDGVHELISARLNIENESNRAHFSISAPNLGANVRADFLRDCLGAGEGPRGCKSKKPSSSLPSSTTCPGTWHDVFVLKLQLDLVVAHFTAFTAPWPRSNVSFCAGPRVNITVSGDRDIALGSIIVPLHVNCRASSANTAILVTPKSVPICLFGTSMPPQSVS